MEESEIRGYEMQFEEGETTELARTVSDGIVDELSGELADEIVAHVGDLVAENVDEAGDADAVVVGTTDRIVKNLNQGGHAYDIVQRTSDIVLDHIPGMVSVFIRRAVKKIVSQLSKGDRSENVIEGVGKVIGAKLVEGAHTEQLVQEVADIVVEHAEGDYAEVYVAETVEEGLEVVVEQDGVERIVETVGEESGAELTELGEEYRLRFTDEQTEGVARAVRDGIDEELSGDQADAVVEAVGELVADNIAGHGDADDIVIAVKDRIVHHLIEGGHADEVVETTADVVLKNLPGMGSSFVRRAVKRIVKELLDYSDEVVAEVGDVIGEKLVEGGHSEDLVADVAEIVVAMAGANDYSEALVEGTLDGGFEILVREEAVADIADAVEAECPAENEA